MIELTRASCIFNWLTMATLVVLLSSCAVQQGQQVADEEVEERKPEKPSIIIVEPGVQKLFDDAVGLMKSENYDAAVGVLEQVVAQEKRLTAPYVNLAIARDKLGDKKKARKHIDDAIAVDEFDAAANNQLGLMLRRDGKFEEAREAYLKALKEKPEYLPAMMNLGILCDIYLRDWDCALEQYRKAQEIKPDDRLKIWIADLERRAGG